MNENNNVNNGMDNANTPYRAVRNLNTAIGNPNINVNSVTTSNILEDNNVQLSNTPVNNVGNDSSNNVGNQVTNVNNIDSGDDINKYINSLSSSTGESSANLNTNNEPPIITSSDDSSLESDNQGSLRENNNVSKTIVYENSYQSKGDKKARKKIAIPTEFRTAIIIVLILLVVLTCFEPIYDFFRNLFSFG